MEAFREILDKQEQSTLSATSVYDDFWGIGLKKVGTDHTDHPKKMAWVEHAWTGIA